MRYFIGFAVTIFLIIVLIILIFHGGSNKTSGPKTSEPLYGYANTGSQVQMKIDGPINADLDHVEIQITVNANAVTYDQIQGYQGNVVNQEQFVNNENAYDAFLRALTIAGYTEGSTSSTFDQYEGHCSQGSRYIFDLSQGGENLEQFWATSCKNVPQSYYGQLPLTMQLFEAQVPKYSDLTRGLAL